MAQDKLRDVRLIDQVFGPFTGLPSWSVAKGHGSFVTMEFGDPQLRISEPTMQSVFLEGAPPTVLRRQANVHGQWHLWIYCCEWSLTLEGSQLAHNESDDPTIARALGVLNGQAISAVTIDPTNGSTRFDFDLACALTTTPAPPGTYSTPTVYQWLLFQPSGDVLTVRSDGRYQLGPGNSKQEDERWEQIPPE